MLDENAVRAIIGASVKGFDISSLKNDEIFDDAGIDSLDHSMILLAIEEKSGKKIPDEAIDLCSSVSGIISFLGEG